MFPPFNSGPFHSNGDPPPPPPAHQVMGSNAGTFPPNQVQFQPQAAMYHQTPIPFNNPLLSFQQQSPHVFNNPQAMGQVYGQLPLNQSLNLGVGCFPPNQMQNINQVLQMLLSNLNGQVVPATVNLPQNNDFLANNSQLGFFGYHGGMSHNSNLLSATQQVGRVQNPQNFGSPATGNSQINRNPSGHHDAHNGKSPRNQKFVRNPRKEGFRGRFMKPHFQNMQQTVGKISQLKEGLFSEKANDDPRKTSVSNFVKSTQAQKKRSILLNYTEEEIKQWQEERKKNYPTKANIEKKRTEKLKDPDVSDEDAKLRRQQLREILAKQAELGCEVAEVPSSYLFDPEAGQEIKENGGALNDKEDFQKKFNKKVRFNQNDRFSKKRGPLNRNSSHMCRPNDMNQNAPFYKNRGSMNNSRSHAFRGSDHLDKKQRLGNGGSVTRGAENQREPTLLQKLLSVDIRRDKHQLLQVFRFMVMNSFFEDCPKKPLKFPQVRVREAGDEGELNGRDYNGRREGIVGETEESVENDNEFCSSMEKADTRVHVVVVPVERKDAETREEGEIID